MRMRRPGGTAPTVQSVFLFLFALFFLGLSPGGVARVLANPLSPADHAIVIVMENKSYREIAGNPDLPSFNGFSGERFTNYWSVAHPSLPNYIALLGAHPPLPGSDDPRVRVPGDSLPQEMERHGLSVAAYMQGLPGDGYGGPSFPRVFGRYVEKHDPFLLFSNLRKGPVRGSVHPLSRLADDLSFDRLPAFSFIAPDLCHDMHGAFACHMSRKNLIKKGDRFLSEWIPRIERSRAFRKSRLWIFVVWDESGHRASWGGPPLSLPDPVPSRMHAGGRVALLWIDSRRPGGLVSPCFANHYSLLETLTENFRLPSLTPPGEAVPLRDGEDGCPEKKNQ